MLDEFSRKSCVEMNKRGLESNGTCESIQETIETFGRDVNLINVLVNADLFFLETCSFTFLDMNKIFSQII